MNKRLWVIRCKTGAAQWSLSSPAQRLLIVGWFWPLSMDGSEMLCRFLSTRGLCCYALLRFSLGLSHVLSSGHHLLHPSAHCVCLPGFFVFAPLLTMCALFLFFFIFSHLLHSNVLLSLQLLLSATLSFCSRLTASLWTPHPTPPHPCLLAPCCAVVAHRSAQDRWSQMISELCSFLRGTAWYCCCCFCPVRT